MFRAKFIEKIKTRILFAIILSRNSFRLLYKVEKYDTVEETKHNNTAHAHLKLDT
jgi:hypothetical protein